MEQKSNQFIIDLKTLNSEGDKKLEKFAKDELININDVVKIINNEAQRKEIRDIVKVTFETLEDDSFQIVVEKVENALKKNNEIVIFPYEKIKSNTNEIVLEDYLGKVTLYNKENSNISVTIDGVSLNLFSMTYKDVEELLCNISDRREKNGYVKLENIVAYKEFGVAIQKDEYSDKLKSIEVYNKEEISKEYDFIEEKYDVDISKIGTNLEYEVPEFNPEEILNDTDEVEIEEIDNKEQLLEDKLSEKLKKFNTTESEEKEDENIEVVLPIEESKEVEDDFEEVEVQAQEKTSEFDNEIQELTDLYEKQKEQQEILENRIEAKLNELKKLRDSKVEEIKVEENKEDNQLSENKTKEEIDTSNSDYKSFVIEGYKGLKEQGKGYLSLYLGQSKDDIRRFFKVTPKEVNDFEEMEMYDNFYAYYDEEDKCTGIGVYNQEENKDKIAVYLFGKNLITMSYKDIVKLIKDHDYKAIEDEDGIISLEYGISIDPKEEKNYKDSICDVIHVFKKGYYDEVYNV